MKNKHDDNATTAAVAATKEENPQIRQRKAKLDALRAQQAASGERRSRSAFPNDFRRDALARDLHDELDALDAAAIEAKQRHVAMAGRIVSQRRMGKASFLHIQDMTGRIQLYLRKNDLPDVVYDACMQWDLGDIIGVEGTLFKTKTNELSVKCTALRLLTKALRPLPEKYHGLADQELRYRQRYLDLIANEHVRTVFQLRAKIIESVRTVLTEHRFLEVETPMMQPLAGGALARPFETHHNALDMTLYLRIAPELYLKRLVVGGFERVFEINRSFRNEGISTRHNPEFTMLEFYAAYTDYQDVMNLMESLLRTVAQAALGTTTLCYQTNAIDLSQPFARYTVKEAILAYNPDIAPKRLESLAAARDLAQCLSVPIAEKAGLGKLQVEIFEKTVERQLIAPTFITGYPTEVSPLARQSDDDPFVADRFELFVGGQEIANGFSELNDPQDQAARFRAQIEARKAGDDEAMQFDQDYITALEHGLPPTAGCGMGIDRLTMLLTDSASIRDVILFPLLRHQPMR